MAESAAIVTSGWASPTDCPICNASAANAAYSSLGHERRLQLLSRERGLQRPAALERATERYLVGVLEIATHRQPTRKSRHRDAHRFHKKG